MSGQELPPRPAPQVLVLHPSASAAGWWSLVGLLLVAAGVWFVVDSGGHPAAWPILMACIAPGAYFAAQLLLPSRMQVRLGPERLQATAFSRRLEVDWEDVHVARVRRWFGDPLLELHVREPSPTGDPWRTHRVPVLLPVGCDLTALHRYLEARLGRGALHPPRRVSPLEL